MAKCGGQRRAAMAMVCALIAAATCAESNRAEAFELKHTNGGQPLRWTESRVSYVIDRSMDQAAEGGSQAIASAIAGWESVAPGIPSLSTTPGKTDAKPGLDGQNSVIFAPKGFAPAGNALAITVTSFDQTSGAIVDTDIVVNGIHPFAVLGKNARAASDEWRVPTDGSSMTDDKQSNEIPYDLVHVLSHEVGHSLGLADEKNDLSALMYGFTSRGDASIRLPSPDDINGVDALYETSPGSSASMSHSGCGQASVAGARSRQTEAWAVWSLVAGAGLWLGLRRRAPRPARIDLPVVAALVGLVVDPVPSAPTHAINPELRADAAARVVRVSTSNVGGLFETTLELEPAVCRQEPCPARTSAHVWGGTLGGIRQEVGSQAVPAVGDLVNVTFVSSPSFNVGGPAAQLVPRGG